MPEPLSAQERAKVYGLIDKVDKALAEKVALFLDEKDDPFVKLVQNVLTNHAQVSKESAKTFASSLDKIETRLQQFMWVMIGISVVAMGLNAGLVGVSMRLDRNSFSVNMPHDLKQELVAPSTQPATMQPTP